MVFVVLATLWLFACKKKTVKGRVSCSAFQLYSVGYVGNRFGAHEYLFSNPTSLFTIDDSLILVLMIIEVTNFAILFIRKGM